MHALDISINTTILVRYIFRRLHWLHTTHIHVGARMCLRSIFHRRSFSKSYRRALEQHSPVYHTVRLMCYMPLWRDMTCVTTFKTKPRFGEKPWRG